MELTLSGCSITHIPKDGKKKKHELKIVHQGADALVLAVQSKEQAEEWLKVTHSLSKLILYIKKITLCRDVGKKHQFDLPVLVFSDIQCTVFTGL